jgi:hypothetical protein
MTELLKNTPLTNDVLGYLRNAANKLSPYEKSYYELYINDRSAIADQIAYFETEAYGADLEVVRLGILFKAIGFITKNDDIGEAAQKSKIAARNILSEIGTPTETVSKVESCLLTIAEKKAGKKLTKEAKIIIAADCACKLNRKIYMDPYMPEHKRQTHLRKLAIYYRGLKFFPKFQKQFEPVYAYWKSQLLG